MNNETQPSDSPSSRFGARWRLGAIRLIATYPMPTSRMAMVVMRDVCREHYVSRGSDFPLVRAAGSLLLLGSSARQTVRRSWTNTWPPHHLQKSRMGKGGKSLEPSISNRPSPRWGVRREIGQAGGRR
jgi:hypothetical protein